ncbi:DUF4097 family beta strand repeat-containing protein [Clostridium saccharobutylicum]|uniref:DUF4097 domain-containing protein n=1 Tax=Clostridium saccharobutylicum DSM 13864 TaxID=1345695 RepID=U5MV69_CLOSA|nr:DUF4097 family beta strand repeat-containing protein [Clostridium saccharobutylicum]AGX43536.1 hypothetical protein CLSA_c25640 [Clostridium saccharobutylicum DSM 13864]AQR90833.1 hypothetical protein CLOSC_25540 [Clostridium saccharobutylicum]AQS00737.1 hypothetical protein CSACC_25610 [Clostridium saccharobutylicum]AQS10399.1 hypothetical protein CLOBY_25420 [Clostridium saccharobutylicum]AQS14720.1 hypothetical protein CLOSACC_25610 [Clostridium saccharobutylicum]
MKKILFLAISGILVILFIGCGINFKDRRNANNNGSKNSGNSNFVNQNLAVDNVTDIDIQLCASKVSVSSYDGDEVKITGELSDKSKGIDINRNNNKIEVVEKGYEFFDSKIGSEDNGSNLEILVPSKIKEHFSFNQGAGEADIKGIIVKNMDIKGGAGKLKCENIKFDKLNLNSSVGEVDLNLDQKCGDIVINGRVGELNLNMAEVGGNLIYKGGVGKSNITIPKNSPVKFITSKGVGGCDINAKTSGEDIYTFDLRVGVGSITVQN